MNGNKLETQTLLSHFNRGEYKEAEELVKKILAKNPKNVLGYKILGGVYALTNRISESIRPLLKAVKLAPTDAEALGTLGNVYKELGIYEDAISCYTKAINLRKDYAQCYYNLSIVFSQIGKPREAENACRQALFIRNNYAPALYQLGLIYQSSGKKEDAETYYKKTLEIQPNHISAIRNILMLKKIKKDDAILKIALNMLQSPLSKNDRCELLFGLSKVFEDLQDNKKSFECLGAANKLRKEVLNYDISSDRKLFDLIVGSYNKLVEADYVPEPTVTRVKPIFIIGMPRSGTSLVEQIISSHPWVDGAGELELVRRFGHLLATGVVLPNNQTINEFRKNYLKRLETYISKGNFVSDKMPHNFLYCGLIGKAFPDAKIIHVTRSPPAVCWSNFKTYFPGRGLGYSFNLDDIVEYYNHYQNLMNFWSEKLPGRIFNLNYELLTEKPEQLTRQLIDYLGIDWDDQCLKFYENKRWVGTASQDQVRRKIYKGSSDEWRKWDVFLGDAFKNMPRD